MKKVKINLGAGTDYKKNWINVDIHKKYNPDIIADLHKKFPFPDSHADEIKAQDILEHFTQEDGEKFLQECWRVLKIGGKLNIRIPNVLQIVRQFRKDPEVMMHFIYGNTRETGIFGAHKFGYTRKYIYRELLHLGFDTIEIEKETTNFVITATKVKKEKRKLKFAVDDRVGLSGNKDVEIVELAAQGLNPVLCYVKLSALKKQNIHAIVLSGSVDRLLATFIARLVGLTVMWVEKAQFPGPKIAYRLVKDIPELVFVPSEKARQRAMRYGRVSQLKIVTYDRLDQITSLIYSSKVPF